MRIKKIVVSTLLLGLCFLFPGCDWDFDSSFPNFPNSFAWDLKGTWVTNNPNSIYYGTLIIDSDRITITGYSETQTPEDADDSKRPFRAFTKGVPLPGYSEEGRIFIFDRGVWQQGIPFVYWYTETFSPAFRRIEFLTFNFGDREETLRKQSTNE